MPTLSPVLTSQELISGIRQDLEELSPSLRAAIFQINRISSLIIEHMKKHPETWDDADFTAFYEKYADLFTPPSCTALPLGLIDFLSRRNTTAWFIPSKPSTNEEGKIYSHIVRLSIERNTTFNSLEKVLKHCPNVQALSLEGRGITNEHIALIVKLRELKTLYLYDTSISGATLGKIGNNLVLLEELILTNPIYLTEKDLTSIANLRNLQRLVLTNRRFDNDDLDPLTHLRSLKTLDLSDCRWVTSINSIHRGFSQIGKLTSLECLNLQGTNVTDEDIAVIGNLINLKELILPSRITEKALAKLSHLTSCKIVRK